MSRSWPDGGPVHLLVESETEIGLSQNSEHEGWMRAGLPPFVRWLAPSNFSDSGFQGLARQGLRRALRSLTFLDHISHLSLPDHGTETTCCRGPLFLGEFGTAICSAQQMMHTCGVGFVMLQMEEEHLWEECPSPPLVQLWENPDFFMFVKRDRSQRPLCLLWLGWLPNSAHRCTGTPGLLLQLWPGTT